MMKRIETVVIGAGQCGLAMSACLLDAAREHIVLERGQVAQAWRERWDSLTLLSQLAPKVGGGPGSQVVIRCSHAAGAGIGSMDAVRTSPCIGVGRGGHQ